MKSMIDASQAEADPLQPEGGALPAGLSPAMLEQMFRHAPVGLQLYDARGRSVFVNPMHTRLFGVVPPADYNVLEDSVLEAIGIAPLIRRAFAGEAVSLASHWYDARDLTNVRLSTGRRVAVQTELVPLRVGGAEVSHVLFVFKDVTEAQESRERAENAAREARQARALAEEAAARAAFLAEAGRLLSSSSLDIERTLQRVTHLATPTVADFCLLDLIEPDGSVRRIAAAHGDPRLQPLVTELLKYPPIPGSPQPAQTVIESGKPYRMEMVDESVLAARTRDAKHFAVMSRLGLRSHMAVPLIGSTGVLGAISLGYVGDRRYGGSELALAEALASRAAVAIENARLYDRIVRSEERFRMMADSVPQIVWITNARGRVEFFNHQWYVYTGRTEVPGLPEADPSLLHPDDVALTVRRFKKAFVTGSDLLVEHRLRSAADEYRWFLTRGVPERDPQTGAIRRWFGASTDIHDLKMAEAALRDTDRRKDEFLAMLAHELRNPLSAISNAYWVVRKKAARPELDRYFDILERQTRRLSRLVDDLLDVSRVTRGLITLRQETVDLASVVQRALESVHVLLEDKRHTVHYEPPAQPVRVIGDPARLEQIVVNLLGNAAKYTDPGGQVSVVLGARDGMAELTITDNGIGMTPEFLAHVFDLFTQAERGLSRSQGGLGIGLTIVKRLVELHGGTVEARSAGLGQGSTLFVRLPLVTQRPANGGREGGGTGAHGPGRRILVVDDNVDIAQTLAVVLETLGHEVEAAFDGREGLARFQASQPEVVLLDIGLPDMDGYEVARRMRVAAAGRPCVLVALTGYGQASDVERALAAGFDHHFVKPVRVEALDAFLRALPGR